MLCSENREARGCFVPDRLWAKIRSASGNCFLAEKGRRGRVGIPHRTDLTRSPSQSDRRSQILIKS
ncbi:hypothetical protein [Phormidium sp. CCY1219]|uniref:hypothetical protein n=1 Tax=Phormidium sp. CCY1219 TaxID=2886104 RepID=UPI002D77ECBB|nr:hypothetical protein [Phormidium sp. CCY1219]